MALSTDVRLPKQHVPRFPDRCIRCGQPPTTTYRVRTRAIGWWTVLFASGAEHSVEIPACAACARRLRHRRHARFVATIGFIVVGVWVASRVLDGHMGGARRWMAAGIALAACLPWFVWQTVFPADFDMTAYATDVEYEFANAEIAEEFAVLNGVVTDE